MTVKSIFINARGDWRDAWWVAEARARREHALKRLANLDMLGTDDLMHPADRFDAAYSIWDDYIDGHREADRVEPLTPSIRAEQASIFARVIAYLNSPKDAVELARQVWGAAPFETFITGPRGERLGKVGWFSGDTVVVTTAPVEAFGLHSFEVTSCAVRGRRGKVVEATETRDRGFATVALHPAYGAGRA